MVEITLESAKHYANPFLDVDVTAAFIGPGGTVIVRPGFWDGGNIWKVRFAPTEVGEWIYQVAASDTTDAGLHGQSGIIRAVPYIGDLAIYQHGFLKKGDTGRYLAYADGTPFFWLSDTHWFFDSKEAWERSNKPGSTSQFREMVDKRVRQKFTVYQSTIFGPSPSYWAKGKVGEQINPDYFKNELDRKFQYIADSGLVHSFAIGFHANIDGNVTTLTRLARYVVARYGAFPMVWITAGEVVGPAVDKREARINEWRQVALAIDKYDAYNHPQSTLYESDWPTYYQGEKWFDFTMVQGGHGRIPQSSSYLNYYRNYPTTPLLEAEPIFEGEGDWANDGAIRWFSYRAIQNGSFGIAYGAQGIWNAVWDTSDTANDFGYSHHNWYEAIDFPGATEMTYLAEFYTSLPWQTLEPQPTGWAQWTLAQPDQDMPSIKADPSAQTVTVYFPDSYDTDGPVGTLMNLRDAPYEFTWFDPRTGARRPSSASAAGPGEWTVEAKPDSQDWLLLATTGQ